MAVHRVAAGLYDENIGATHVFENLKINLSIAETVELGFAQRHFQMLADTLRKRQIGGARENLEAIVLQEALAPDLRKYL
jgi:hypothetical protein